MMLSEFQLLGVVGIAVSMYLSVGSSVSVMVFLVVCFVFIFFLYLVMITMFLWGVIMGLLYVSGMMVLFSYTTMLKNFKEIPLESKKYKDFFFRFLWGTVLLMTAMVVVYSKESGFHMSESSLSFLWFYSTSFFYSSILVLVCVLFSCLKMCTENWS